MVSANFFWHGPRLRLYERACLSSFVKQGFEVNLYTFNRQLQLPAGVNMRDAGKFAREDEVFNYSQNGFPGSIAAFSDIFRYRLFQENPGWYFDTDVFCLRSADDYRQLETTSKGMIVGEQKRNSLNGAVLYVSDPTIAVELHERAKLKGTDFVWGEIGPVLITEFATASPSRVTILDKPAFYPVHHWEIDLFYKPQLRQECEQLSSSAYCVHLWNEVIGRWKIPRDILPPKGSYLDTLFSSVDARVDVDATLSEETIAALQNQANTDGWYKRVIDLKLNLRKKKKLLKQAAGL